MDVTLRNWYKGALLICVFIIVFTIKSITLPTKDVHTDPDSITYQYLSIPNLPKEKLYRLQRPPFFPAYLYLMHSIFKTNETQAYLIFNRILSSIAIILLAATAYKLSSSILISCVALILFMMNLQVSQFDITLNPEGLSSFLVALYVYCMIHMKHKFSSHIVFLYILITILIFTKPIFVYLLPLTYTFLLFINRKKAPIFTIHASTYIATAFLIIYSFINSIAYNHFAISSVSSINLAGKLLQYNLAQDGPTSPKYQPVRIALLTKGEYQDIYWRLPILYSLTPIGTSPFSLLSEYSIHTISKTLPQYIHASIEEVIPIVTSIPTSSDLDNGIYISKPILAPMTQLYNHLYDAIFIQIKHYIFPLFLGVTLLNVFAIIKFNSSLVIKLIFINTLLWTHIMVMCVTAYSEYTRILAPIMNTLLMYELVMVHKSVLILRKATTKIYSRLLEERKR